MTDAISELLQRERETGIRVNSARVKLERMKYDFDQLGKKITNLRREILALEKTEMHFAREWWKDGKYLYHVFPQDKGGKRKRVYIGCDVIAVQTARAKVDRWERHRELKGKLAATENELAGYDATLGLMAERLKRSIGDTAPALASKLRHQNGQDV